MGIGDILSVLYPERCIVCGRVLWQEEKGVCPKCRSRLPLIKGRRCVKCSKAVTDGNSLCMDCRVKKHTYDCGFALWSYNSVTRKIIAGIKYSGRRSNMDYAVSELVYHSALYMRQWKTDAVIPVPLHYRKLRERGFNQAELLAKEYGKLLNVICITDVLRRTRYTRPQKHFDDEGRINNLKGAFEVNEGSFKNYGRLHSVALVDDIYTSGSTIDSCAGELKKAGIDNVYFISLCIGDGY